MHIYLITVKFICLLIFNADNNCQLVSALTAPLRSPPPLPPTTPRPRSHYAVCQPILRYPLLAASLGLTAMNGSIPGPTPVSVSKNSLFIFLSERGLSLLRLPP